MQRDYRAYLDDVLESILKIEKYTANLDFDSLKSNDIVLDATIRNLEIIGEAIKNIPEDFKKKHNEIEWKKIAGLRDILIHDYFGISMEIIWDIIQNKLPELKNKLLSIIKECD